MKSVLLQYQKSLKAEFGDLIQKEAAALKNIPDGSDGDNAPEQDLKKLADDLQSGKGLAGTMLKNEQLATNVQEIADNLAIATSNLNRLGLWRFLWHHEPPHTNETTLKP